MVDTDADLQAFYELFGEKGREKLPGDVGANRNAVGDLRSSPFVEILLNSVQSDEPPLGRYSGHKEKKR
jgi:hypothetical protein